MLKRLIAFLVIFTFTFSNVQYGYAQEFSINQLPVPGTMIGISEPFAPLAIKGVVVNPQKPLEFQFIVDTGKGPQDKLFIKDEANRLVKYFLAGLTIPEEDLWVNLSPYEKNRMITPALGQTELGRDLLAQDYILKQLTASLIYPENGLGKEFWSRVYARAQQQFGTTDIPVNTFNKVWILPKEAQVFENGSAAYITKSTLKVMLDEDYLALSHHVIPAQAGIQNKDDSNTLGSQIVRQIVLPEIEKEVNTGRNFAPLRQIFDAMILAKWYKETIQNGLLDAVYTNKKKIAGVNLADPAVKEKIYQRYLQAYKKGVFNYIKEDSAPDGQTTPRKYFSGGISRLEPEHVDTNGPLSAVKKDGAMINITVTIFVIGLAALVGGGIYGWFDKRPMRELARRINEQEALERAGEDQSFISYIEEFKLGHREKLVSNLFYSLTKKWDFKIRELKARLSAEEFKELRNMLGYHILYDLDSRYRSSSYDDGVIAEAETISSKPDGDLLLTDEVKSLIEVRKLVVKRLYEMDAPTESLPENRIRGTDPLSLAGLKEISKILASGKDFKITSDIVDEPSNTGEPIYLDYTVRTMTYTIGVKETDSAMLNSIAQKNQDMAMDAEIEMIRQSRDIGFLISQLDNTEKEIRSAAAFKLVGINDASVIDPLIKYIHRERSFMLVDTLVKLRDPRVKNIRYVYDKFITKFTTNGRHNKSSTWVEPLTYDIFREALVHVEAGYDFEINITPEETHQEWDVSYMSWGTIIDKPAEINIVRLNKLPDTAMIGQTTAQKTRRDNAELAKDLGGIDLNQINIKRLGNRINVQFDPAQLKALEQGGFEGFKPVITNITNISSPLPLMGVGAGRQEELLAKA